MELSKRRLIGPGLDVLAPDLGSGQVEMGFIEDMYTMIAGSGDPNAIASVTGKPFNLGGIKGRKSAAGRGLYHGVHFFMKDAQYATMIGMDPSTTLWDKTFIVQGFGNVGSYSAVNLCKEEKMKLIGVIEEDGSIFNDKGIDAINLQEHMQEHNTILGFPGVQTPAQTDLLEAECDLLVLAYRENVINRENVDRIKAKVIAEGADGPITSEAEGKLLKKEKLIIPDVYLNSGAVFVSYLEWLKNTQHARLGFFEGKKEEEVVEERLVHAMESAAEKLKEKAKDHELGLNLRTAAYIVTLEKIFDTYLDAGFTI